MRILVAGDYCDKLRVSEYIKHADYSSLFDSIKPIVTAADYSIVNFEFPVVLHSSNPILKYGPNLKGQKQAVDAISYAGFKCCTLANNHILDQGEECSIETKHLLEDSGIDTVGFGCNLPESESILYKTINGEVLAIINCCENEFSIATENSAGSNPLNPIRQYYKIQEARKSSDYVLVIVHGGHENFQLPSSRMKDTYRFFVDAGADAVVNHHQHCFSGYEIYQGKPIFYGIGNFLFDHKSSRNDSWNFGFMLLIDFDHKKITYELYPYKQSFEKVTVRPLTGNEIIEFETILNNLNSIIQDDKLLKEKVGEYYTKCLADELNIFESYRGRVLWKLFSIGLLPSTLSKSKIVLLYNHIMCESHNDKLKYALINMISKIR